MKPQKYLSYAEVDKDGVPRTYDKQGVLDWCRMHPGKRVEIHYKVVVKKPKYNLQMRWYRGVIIPYIIHGFFQIGMRMDEHKCHQILRDMSSVKVDYYDIEDKTIKSIASTGEFSKDDWTDYLEEIIQFAAENLHVAIPEPTYDTHKI